MTRLLLRLAPRLAYSRQATQRWRQLSVVFGAFCLTLTVLVSTGVLLAAEAAGERRVARMPVLAVEREPAGLAMVVRGEIWGGRQFPVVWLGPGDGHRLLPPGLAELPPPGTAVLSPGVAAAGFAHDGLGFRVASAGTGPGGVIGAEGLATASEWLIYASPPAGRRLEGEGVLFRIKGYGPRPGEPTLNFETEDPFPSTKLAGFGVMWLLLLPVGLLAATCAVALSPLRSTRAQTCFRLGLSPSAVRMLGALETVVLAAPAAVTAALLWLLAAPSVRSLPGTGLVMFPGGFVVPLPLVAAGALSCVVLLAVLGAVSLRPARSASWTSRRLGSSARVRAWRAAPLAGALGLMVAARPVGGPSGANMIMAALCLTVLSLPLAMPWLVHRLGNVLAALRRPPAWLAGRRLTFSAVPLARPAVAVGVLVFIAGSVTGIHQRFAYTEADDLIPVNNYLLSWRDPRATDADWLRTQLPDARLALVERHKAVFDSCAAAASFAQLPERASCRSADELTPAARAAFRTQFQLSPRVEPGAHLSGRRYDAATLIAGGPATTDQQIWRVANSQLTAVNLSRLGGEPLAPPQASAWLVGAGGAAISLLLLTLLHSFGNRVLSLVGEDRRLLRIALDAREVRAVQRWTLFPPLSVSIPLGAVAALIFNWAGNPVQLARPVTGLILLESLAIAALSAAATIAVLALQRTWTGGKAK